MAKVRNPNIVFNVVSERSRSTFLQKHFGHPLFDQFVFNIADNIMVDYKGGYWDYVEASVTTDEEVIVPFVELHSDKPIILTNPFSGESFEFDSHLAGIIITMYAVNHFAERRHAGGFSIDKVGEVSWKLRDLAYDYAKQVNKGAETFSMLD